MSGDQRCSGAAPVWRTTTVAILVWFLGTAAAQAQGTPVADRYDQTRSTSFTYYGAADGVFNGLLKNETVEPGNAQLCVTTTYSYDSYGNRIRASTANCTGATGLAAFAERAASTTFAAQTVTVAGVANVVIPAGAFAVTASNALNQSESREFDPRFGVLTSLTGPNGLTTRWTVDNFGRKTMEVRADGTRTLSAYCYIRDRIDGNPLSSNSAASNGDPLDCPSPGTDEIPAGAAMFVHTEPHDNSAGLGAKNGPFARAYSDKAGRKIRSVTEAFDGALQPGGASRLIVQDTDYDQYGTQTVSTQPYFLDTCASTAGAVGSCPSGNYGMTHTDYDALGRVIALYSADVTTTDSNSGGGNAGGSQAAGITAFGTRGSKQAAKTEITYAGLVTITINDKKQTRTEEKNVDGKVVRVTDELLAQIVHQHDAFGNLVRTIDALQNTITIAYDARGRKVSMADPDTGLWKYDYNALGELVWQQSPNQRAAAEPGARQTTMAYDLLGRMTSRVEPEFVSTWSYDRYADGTLCMQGAVATRGTGKLCESGATNYTNRKFVYDSLGRPVNTRATFAGGPSFASAVSYDDKHGRLASMTYPTGVQVNYNYTTNGFLSNLALAQAASITPLPATAGGAAGAAALLDAKSTLWSAQAYNAWGRVEQSQYGNNVVNRATFDAITGRTTSITAGIGEATNVVKYSYTWDSINLLTQRSDANGDGTGGAVTDILSYDDIGRLTGYRVWSSSIPELSRGVSLQYNALGMVLYKSDVGVYRYGAQATAGVKPHALLSVTGAINASYTYDANGNLTEASAGSYRTVAYTSFNLPDGQTGAQGPAGSHQYTWLYDENHARVRETRVVAGVTRTTWSLHPDSQGGLGFECESAGSSRNCDSPSTQRRHYLSVGGMSIGVLVSTGPVPTLLAGQMTPPTVDPTTKIALVKVEYWHKDHLGSLVATTDHTGSVTARYSYDPFGKRRQAAGQYDAFGTLVIDWTSNTNSGTDRGYTGHEHLDDIGLIHMNGRIFDPRLGLFMQGDPFIQDPTNLQNYNRYGYCFNNPMTCTDPSGFSFWTKLRNAVTGLPIISKIAHSKIGYQIGSIVIGVVSVVYCGEAGAGAVAACNGAGQAAWAGFSGRSFGESVKTGVIAGATSYAFTQVGDWTTSIEANELSGTATPYMSDVDKFANVAGHAAVGCASTSASGGSCRNGAISAGVSAAYTNVTDGGAFKGTVVMGTIEHAMLGGFASVASGGKFADGAQQGAFGYLFNCSLHQGACTAEEIKTKAQSCRTTQCINEVMADASEAKLPNGPNMGPAVNEFIDLTTRIARLTNPVGFLMDQAYAVAGSVYDFASGASVEGAAKFGGWVGSMGVERMLETTGKFVSGRAGVITGWLFEAAEKSLPHPSEGH